MKKDDRTLFLLTHTSEILKFGDSRNKIIQWKFFKNEVEYDYYMISTNFNRDIFTLYYVDGIENSVFPKYKTTSYNDSLNWCVKHWIKRRES